MKAIINGRRYDTDAAREIGSFSAGEYMTAVCETLYQKRTGEFFLCGEGESLTKYAEYIGDNRWKSGASLIPLSRDSARDWAEQHLSADVYEQLFEVLPDDDGGPEALHVQLPASLMARVRRKAHESGLTLRDIVTQALNAYITSDDP